MEQVLENNKNKELTKERDISIDIYKAFLIFLIVLGHTMVTNNQLAVWANGIHIPAFFFLAGYTYKEYRCFGKFLLKKFIRLLLPYFLVGMISILVFFYFGDFVAEKLQIDIKSTEILPNVKGMLYASGQTGYMKWNLPLWYIPALFSSLIIYYWANKIIEIIPFNKEVIKAIFMFLFLGFSLINNSTLHINALVFGIDNALYCLPFIFLGSIVKDFFNIFILKKRYLLLLGILMVILGSFFILACKQNRVNYIYNEFGNIYLFYISSALLSVGFFLIFKLFSKRNLFSEIGKHTLFILLFHKFLIILEQIHAKKFLLDNKLLDISCSLGVSIVITLFLFGVAFLLTFIFNLIFKRKRKEHQSSSL